MINANKRKNGRQLCSPLYLQCYQIKERLKWEWHSFSECRKSSFSQALVGDKNQHGSRDLVASGAAIRSPSTRFFFFFFFFFLPPLAYGAPGEGSDLRGSCELICSCSNARSLTHCAGWGLNLRPSAPKTLPILLHHSRSSKQQMLDDMCVSIQDWNS